MTGARACCGWLRWLARAAIAMAAALPAAHCAQAQSPDPADLAEGMRLFLQKGNCQACHGWAADGRKADNQMPDSPSLRETALDRDSLILTVK